MQAVKNREWVKNAAILFLSIMLVLTFFSNTIMNRNLPEVSTQMVQSGSIVAKVRGSGMVEANGIYQEKADQTREIRAVMIKSGQQVNAGDPLFILGEGDSEELEALQESMRQLQISYQRAAINMPVKDDYPLEKRQIENAKNVLKKAEVLVSEEYQKLVDKGYTGDNLGADAAAKRLEEAKLQWKELNDRYNKEMKARNDVADAYTAAESKWNDPKYDQIKLDPATVTDEALKAEFAQVEKDFHAANEAKLAQDATAADFADLKARLDAAKARVDTLQGELDYVIGMGTDTSAYEAAQEKLTAAQDNLAVLENDLKKKREQDDKSLQSAYLELSSISDQISRLTEQINELSGGDQNQILSKVSGTVQSVEIMAGSTAAEGAVLCTIEVPDQGYSLSFSVTNEQSRRLKIGDTATVSNYYWGSEIVATLSSIKTDPQKPMTNKLLSFDLEGDVNAGSELSLSVGQKSAGYDCIIPSSAIRSDTNGSFVYLIEAKSSPLGNRYKAKRCSVEVLASDDNNSAVTGDLQNGDYVITISNAPIQNNDLVRMSES